MRRLIASVISAAMTGVVLLSLAMAIELPINGTYGSSEAACSYYHGGGYLSDRASSSAMSIR